jgi:hypothetical protein
MTTRFDETVQKLASSPQKVALLRAAPSVLSKSAAFKDVLTDVFGGPKEHMGYQKVLQTLTGTLGAASILGAGSLAWDKFKNNAFGNQDEEKAKHVETGKLQAQNQFKLQSLMTLKKQHEDVLSKVMKDDIISKADKPLMHSAYGTMVRFAPNLAADENAAKSFLREHAIYGTGPSYAALKNLADAEQAVARAGGVL